MKDKHKITKLLEACLSSPWMIIPWVVLNNSSQNLLVHRNALYLFFSHSTKRLHFPFLGEWSDRLGWPRQLTQPPWQNRTGHPLTPTQTEHTRGSDSPQPSHDFPSLGRGVVGAASVSGKAYMPRAGMQPFKPGRAGERPSWHPCTHGGGQFLQASPSLFGALTLITRQLRLPDY